MSIQKPNQKEIDRIKFLILSEKNNVSSKLYKAVGNKKLYDNKYGVVNGLLVYATQNAI